MGKMPSSRSHLPRTSGAVDWANSNASVIIYLTVSTVSRQALLRRLERERIRERIHLDIDRLLW